MRTFIICLILFAVAGVAFSTPDLQAPLRASTLFPLDDRWPTDTPVRICAIRVQFLEDHVSGTTGTGRMGSGFDSSLVIDPLPHDKQYFEDHLRFLQHYYRTVSNNRLQITTTDVYPSGANDVYQLDFPMWHYNYNDGDDDRLNRKLTELFVQSVIKAENEVDFSNYDAVLVFHAGTGKDFNLGYDATPFDIPSAYISEADLRQYALNVPLPAGVTRGLVLPEGENQAEALDYDIELSLNGIMVKLFGNWLGLPDLFDTKTGRSGIGRWGMMDQGSGNMNALVPAVPDAWSRVYMGWDTTLDVVPSASGDTLRIARVGHHSANRVVRFPITPREYYLMENRDSDADSINYVELRDRNGRRLTINHDGDIAVEAGFRVAVEASHYDFGIPGSGLLLWHINEDAVERGMADNTVNADPELRGVDLVEADGAQDIGNEYGFASAGSGAELGIPEDAWYRDNLEHRAANRNALVVRFADRTFPSARLNDGAFTRLELTAFSDIDSVMTFIARTDGVISGFPVAFPSPADWVVADLDGDTLKEIYFVTESTLYQRDSSVATLPAGFTVNTDVAAVDLDGDGRDEILLQGNGIGIIEYSDNIVEVRTVGLSAASSYESIPVFTESDSGLILGKWNSQAGMQLVLYGRQLDLRDSITLMTIDGGQLLNYLSFPTHEFAIVSPGQMLSFRIHSDEIAEVWRIEDSRIIGTGSVVAEPDRASIFLDGLGYLDAVNGVILCLEPDCIAPQEDWDGDGIPDGGGRFGRQDAPRENMPKMSADKISIIDLEADGLPDMLGQSSPGHIGAVPVYSRISAVSHRGSAYTFFPVAASVPRDRNPFTWARNQILHYVSMARTNGRYSYSVNRLLPSAGSNRSIYHDAVNLYHVGVQKPYIHDREEWVYCWPNPAAQESRIRITLPFAAEATIDVFDLAGRKIVELEGRSDNAGAFEVPWDVRNVESGVYLAVVEARGGNQAKKSQIKIAVVK